MNLIIIGLLRATSYEVLGTVWVRDCIGYCVNPWWCRELCEPVVSWVLCEPVIVLGTVWARDCNGYYVSPWGTVWTWCYTGYCVSPPGTVWACRVLCEPVEMIMCSVLCGPLVDMVSLRTGQFIEVFCVYPMCYYLVSTNLLDLSCNLSVWNIFLEYGVR